jgi:hypothetical protein
MKLPKLPNTALLVNLNGLLLQSLDVISNLVFEQESNAEQDIRPDE